MIIKPNFSDSNLPLMEYPRPQFARESYISLNGLWDYSILPLDNNSTKNFPSENETDISNYQGKILVPFSPEAKLSQVERQLQKDEVLIYKTDFSIPTDFNKGRVLLNFGACDQCCQVFINNSFVGSHEGGYLPFTFDITDFLQESNTLVVKVIDDADSPIYARGKQVYKPGGIWYTATSGIWQSVWLESVPKNYLQNAKFFVNFDEKKLDIECFAICADDITSEEISICVYDDDKLISQGSTTKLEKLQNNLVRGKITLDISECKEWDLENPELYNLTLKFQEDLVKSYFGLRKFSIIEKDGFKFFALNNKPIFHNGLLDQGYWHESFYTPPTNQAMFQEISNVKKLGFNMLRKHIKVEPMLWYYYCDILGVLVWQDMINGGEKYPSWRIALCPFFNLHLNDKNYKFMGRSLESRNQYYIEAQDMMSTLFNCVSLCLWTPFNEAWGQFDAFETWEKLKKIDDSRAFDHASGWQDKGGGDVNSKHIYFRKARMKNDKKRVLALTEFGGYSMPLENHFFANKKFGYKMFSSPEKLKKAYEKLFLTEIIPLIKKQKLGATVYTELTDVEDEINGLFTYDRVLKIEGEKIKEINQKLYTTFNELF